MSIKVDIIQRSLQKPWRHWTWNFSRLIFHQRHLSVYLMRKNSTIFTIILDFDHIQSEWAIVTSPLKSPHGELFSPLLLAHSFVFPSKKRKNTVNVKNKCWNFTDSQQLPREFSNPFQKTSSSSYAQSSKFWQFCSIEISDIKYEWKYKFLFVRFRSKVLI